MTHIFLPNGGMFMSFFSYQEKEKICLSFGAPSYESNRFSSIGWLGLILQPPYYMDYG